MLTIIGCGNPNRSDDGAGIAVAHGLVDRLKMQCPKNVRIFDAGTDGMGVMFQARGASSLILVDASSIGAEPGAIFEVPGHELEGKPPESFTLHDFRWDHALFAGRKIFRDEFPADVTVYLIEAASLDLGLELTPEAAAAVERVIESILLRISDHEQSAP